ncbi:hypothetical protein OCJ37_00880 [Xanthomonas sp. AM6]|uniref:hypothetical protein n=1 Tax=Xanthomonas sp. AM6 TaxID=2982531 RepID=UPI0021D892D7|nr:hypothetical protein [Xanthomonas sp. AM6]UYB52554.1 hypothetical protein OCJ37_00880 [Xanthomonas sp. AM6]
MATCDVCGDDATFVLIQGASRGASGASRRAIPTVATHGAHCGCRTIEGSVACV